MYGMRRAGKTTMLLHMLEDMKERFKFTQVHVFSGTADENPAQWKNFPPGFVTADIANIDVHIGDILRQQQEQIREEVYRQVSQKSIQSIQTKRKRGEQPGASKKRKHEISQLGAEPEVQNDTTVYEQDEFSDISRGKGIFQITTSQINALRRAGKIDESRFPRRLIVLDDVVNENRIRYSQNLNKLAVSGRHIFISCIILSQSVTGSASVPPIIRRNSDYIMVVGYPRSVNERKMIAEEYLTIGNESDAKEKSLRILKDVTQKQYRAFVINVTNSTATEFNQFLFSYGPVPPPPRNVSKKFKLGTSEQWAYKTHHGDRKDEFTKDNMNRKPSKPRGNFTTLPGSVDDDGAGRPIMRTIQPMYRSRQAAESGNPYAVREYFDPIF